MGTAVTKDTEDAECSDEVDVDDEPVLDDVEPP